MVRPIFAGARYTISDWAVTVGSARLEFAAPPNSASAKVNSTPPWHTPKPLACRGSTVNSPSARPGSRRVMVAPRNSRVASLSYMAFACSRSGVKSTDGA